MTADIQIQYYTEVNPLDTLHEYSTVEMSFEIQRIPWKKEENLKFPNRFNFTINVSQVSLTTSVLCSTKLWIL